MPQRASRIQSTIATAATLTILTAAVALAITHPDWFATRHVNVVYTTQPQEEVPVYQPAAYPYVAPQAMPMGAVPRADVRLVAGFGNVIFINAPCPHRQITIQVQPGAPYHYVCFNDRIYRKIFVRDGQACYVDDSMNTHHNIYFQA